MTVREDKVYHIVTQVLYQHGHVSEKGYNVLKIQEWRSDDPMRPQHPQLMCQSVCSDEYGESKTKKNLSDGIRTTD